MTLILSKTSQYIFSSVLLFCDIFDDLSESPEGCSNFKDKDQEIPSEVFLRLFFFFLG